MTISQWELGGEIIAKGANHAAIATVRAAWDEVLKKIAEVQVTSANFKQVGYGRTEDPTIILANVVPSLRELAETAKLVADQLESRLSGA